MGARALRGIHASGFALDTPLSGLPDLRGSLRDLVIDARYRAAERVFGTAIARGADLLLLVGGILSAETGPGSRGPWFLLEQFRRLAHHGIPVVWAETSHELHDWIAAHVPLPSNVTLLSGEATTRLAVRGAEGEQTVALHCRSAGSVVPVEKGTADWNVVLAPSMTVDFSLGRWADYVGQAGPNRALLSEKAFSSGASQGSGFHEPGAHGCLSFTLDHDDPPRTEFIPTDVVRWAMESVPVTRESSLESLRRDLAYRLAQFPAGHSCDAWIVGWQLDDAALSRVEPFTCETLLAELQQDALDNDLAAWPGTLSVSLSPLRGELQFAEGDETQSAVWNAARHILNPADTSLDLADLLGDGVRGVPPLVRTIPAGDRRIIVESLLCTRAVRTLAARSLTALR